jgi:DNA-binding ferritin-like protein
VAADRRSDIGRLQRLSDNDAEYVEPLDMLAELREDNKTLAASLREARNVCEEHRDVATASVIEVWVDEAEAERRTGSRYRRAAPSRSAVTDVAAAADSARRASG